MRRSRDVVAAAGLFAALALPANAVAQSPEILQLSAALERLEGTLRVQMEPHVSEGVVVGCQFVFDAVMRDWSYSQGGFLKVSGSVALVGAGGNIGATAKAVVNALDERAMEFRPSAPGRVYLISKDLRTSLPSLVDTYESDVPGGRFSVYQMSPTAEMILEAMDTNRLTVAFNLNGGKTDLKLPVELDVVSTDDNGNRSRSDDSKNAFSRCIRIVIDQMKTAAGK